MKKIWAKLKKFTVEIISWLFAPLTGDNASQHQLDTTRVVSSGDEEDIPSNLLGKLPLPDGNKPKFPRREEFALLEDFRRAMNRYDDWVKSYKKGKYIWISKYAGLPGRTYVRAKNGKL